MKSSNFYSNKILDVRVDFGYTVDGAVKKIEDDLLNNGKCNIVCTTNPEFIMLAQNDRDFKDIINSAALSLPDGSGVVFADEYQKRIGSINRRSFTFKFKALILGLKLGIFENSKATRNKIITGVDLMDKICQLSNTKKYSIFLLGGEERNFFGKRKKSTKDVSKIAEENIRKKYPYVNIIGSTSQFRHNSFHDTDTIKYIQHCMSLHAIKNLDFLLVCYGQGNQEKWIIRNANNIPASVSVGLGRSFEYYSQIMKIPPTITYKYNISWLYTLIKEPWRIKRVFNAFPVFPLKIFINSIK